METRQSHTLYGVAALFVAGHLLRVLLNLHDLAAHLARQQECGGKDRLPDFPAWSLVSRMTFVRIPTTT